MAKRSYSQYELILLALLVLQLALLVISLPGQRIHGDEAAFAEFAYFQAETGHPRSELFRGLLGYEDRVFIYHKLFQWFGAVVVKVAGYGAWPLRALSMVAGIGLIALLYRHMRRDESLGGLPGFLGACAFLALAPLTFKFVKLYRPELMQAAVGFGSYMTLTIAMRRRQTKWIISAGALAGLAMLTHLNGVIYVIAGCVPLLLRKQWRYTLAFGITALAVFSTYFYDVVGHFGAFWQQYAFDPTFSKDERTVTGSLLKLLDEHKRLFRKPEIIFTSVLFFVSVAISLWRDRSKRSDFYVYVATCILALGALAPAKTTPYAILLFPFFAVETGRLAASFWQAPRQYSKATRYVLVAAMLAFVLHSIAADAINAFADKQDWTVNNRRLASYLEPHSAVLAPMDFVFDELPNYRIAGMRLADWKVSQWGTRSYTASDLAAYADSAGIPAIILDREPRAQLGLRDATVGAVCGEYRVVANLSDIESIILKK